MANMPIAARAEVVQKTSVEILARRDDLAVLLARDEGKIRSVIRRTPFITCGWNNMTIRKWTIGKIEPTVFPRMK